MVAPVSIDDIRQVRYLQGLSDDELRRFAARLDAFAVAPKQYVLVAGDTPPGFFLLRSGKARIFRSGVDGREQTLRVVAPGDTFGEVPVFDGQPAPSTVEALEPCEVIVIPTLVFMELLFSNPRVAVDVLRQFARRLRAFTEMVEQMSLQTVQARLARHLYQIAREEGVATSEGLVVPRTLTLQDLASLLGSVREVVSRTMRVFEEDGLIVVHRKEIVIKDLQALQLLV
ncbi:MAG: Crp/Fnr family transcriptional regulator [Dehalococcoidia bacterium]|nr:Crp/Fnr family transcriptional regulator [Dehalococcoidia bacterium]